MLDIGWTELLLIGVVALIVIGPKDLPQVFHALGRIMARARGMAREFTSAMEDAAKASGLDEVQKTIRDAGSVLPHSPSSGVQALTRAAERFEAWDPKLPSARADVAPDPAMSSAPPAMASPASAVPPEVVPVPPAPPADLPPQPGARRLHAVRRRDTT